MRRSPTAGKATKAAPSKKATKGTGAGSKSTKTAQTGRADPSEQVITSVNSSPIFQRLASSLDYQRVGLQLHRNGRVEYECTNYLSGGRLAEFKMGLHNPEFVIRIDLDAWDRINTPQEAAWMKEHPLEAVRKYWRDIEMPFTVKLRIGAKLLGI